MTSSAANGFVTCMENNPVENCAQGIATLTTHLRIVAHSLSGCGNAQAHPFISKYGGSTACHFDVFPLTIAATTLVQSITSPAYCSPSAVGDSEDDCLFRPTGAA
ncbi:hypothetical protein DPMN_085278 [Dreissena polymorpha]|uniref:Uncharacterized protein n=1 Tax=Dreissena polymorpha TaxID=45954 RepID=A0A9D3YC37_DREPO|nr:hypothetical protein DPMN_085278 [Dreissena polymorpha]